MPELGSHTLLDDLVGHVALGPHGTAGLGQDAARPVRHVAGGRADGVARLSEEMRGPVAGQRPAPPAAIGIEHVHQATTEPRGDQGSASDHERSPPEIRREQTPCQRGRDGRARGRGAAAQAIV